MGDLFYLSVHLTYFIEHCRLWTNFFTALLRRSPTATFLSISHLLVEVENDVLVHPPPPSVPPSYLRLLPSMDE